MDRQGRRSGRLIGVAALTLAAAAAAPPPLRALRWLDPAVDPVVAMTRRPAECLTPGAAPAAIYEIELGRAAFNDPLLLGGQAARAGLSCASCHLNGRDNPHFAFPGISGAPGTANVSTFLFSSHRGRHDSAPRPIPDLARAKALMKVTQDPASGALERFVTGLVAEEFDGPPPAPSVVAGLAAYLRALGPEGCAGKGEATVTVARALIDARRFVRVTIQAMGRGDEAAALTSLEAARSTLGLVFERYAAPDLATARGALAQADLDLAAAMADLRRHDPGTGVRLEAWLAAEPAWAATLARDESRSLYSRAVLAAALAPRRAS